MADDAFTDEMNKEPPPLGIGFAVLLGVLLSLPLWAGIVWLALMIW